MSRVYSNLRIRILILAGYAIFAAVIFRLHGSSPNLNVDHIAYIKLANEIIADHPAGDYWREISTVRTYGVLMAYLHSATGNHVETLKWLLAGMTVAYLAAAESMFFAFGCRRLVAVLMAIASAFHFSFGATFWGMTDFSASLNRSLALPPMLILVGWYIRHHDSPWRMAIYPVLIALSLLHLGTYYLLAIVVSADGLSLIWDHIKRVPGRWRYTGAYVAAIVAVLGVYQTYSALRLNSTSLFALVLKPGDQLTTVFTSLDVALDAPAWAKALSSDDAWAMEAYAQPWRLFPPPIATVLGILSSVGSLVVIAIWCGLNSIRRTGMTPVDRKMLLILATVLLGSYGLQTSLWILRHFSPVYPISFEEVRMIHFTMIPLLYLVSREISRRQATYDVTQGFPWREAALLTGVLIQPIHVIRALPISVREGIFSTAVSTGWLDSSESLRNRFAREFLHLTQNQRQLYYSVQPVFDWLAANVHEEDRILTTRDDLFILPARVLGTSNGFLDTSSASLRRLAWSIVRTRLDAAIREKDMAAVLALADECKAAYVVVPWDVADAAFRSDGFSIIHLAAAAR